MAHACIMIIIPATFSGIFNGTQMLSGVESTLEKLSEKIPLPVMTLLTGIPLIMVSCNQTLALMLQVPLIRPIYEKRGISHGKLMLDLSDTTALFSFLTGFCFSGCCIRFESILVNYYIYYSVLLRFNITNLKKFVSNTQK